MTAKKRVFLFSLVATVLAFAVLFSPYASAVDLNIEVRSYWAGGLPSATHWRTSDGMINDRFVCGGGTDYRRQVYAIELVFPSNMGVQKGDFIQLELSATSDGNSNNNIDFASALYDAVGSFDVIDVKYAQMGMASGRVEITLMAKSAGVYQASLERAGGGTVFSMQNANGVECMATGNWTAYRAVGDSSQAIINAINSNNSSQAIEDAKDEIVGAIEEQQQTQQDIYDDEKDTIQGGIDDASDSAESVDTSGFTFGNPFAAWFNLFTDNTCVDIPTLASWLNTNETRVCSPWSGTNTQTGRVHTNVRQYATPIVSALSVTILFGFLIHWLKGDSDVGLENT